MQDNFCEDDRRKKMKKMKEYGNMTVTYKQTNKWRWCAASFDMTRHTLSGVSGTSTLWQQQRKTLQRSITVSLWGKTFISKHTGWLWRMTFRAHTHTNRHTNTHREACSCGNQRLCPKGRRDKSRSVEKQEVVWRGRKEPRPGLSHTHTLIWRGVCLQYFTGSKFCVCVCVFVFVHGCMWVMGYESLDDFVLQQGDPLRHAL